MIIFHNLNLDQKLTFDEALNSEYILNSKDYGTVTSKRNTTQYIDLIGSHVDSTALNERDITFTGIVTDLDKNVVAQKKKIIKSFFNPLHDIVAFEGEYCITFKCTQTAKDIKDEDTFYKFGISAVAYDPLFKLKNNNVLYESKPQPSPLFPLAIPKNKGIAFGFIPAVSVNNPPNLGDVEVGFVMRMTADEGNVSNPKIINNRTGEVIEVIIELMQGDSLEVSTVNGDKYVKLLRGNSEIDAFKYVTTKSTMSMKLQQGVNDLTVTASGNSINLSSSIIYSPRWLEVG